MTEEENAKQRMLLIDTNSTDIDLARYEGTAGKVESRVVTMAAPDIIHIDSDEEISSISNPSIANSRLTISPSSSVAPMPTDETQKVNGNAKNVVTQVNSNTSHFGQETNETSTNVSSTIAVSTTPTPATDPVDCPTTIHDNLPCEILFPSTPVTDTIADNGPANDNSPVDATTEAVPTPSSSKPNGDSECNKPTVYRSKHKSLTASLNETTRSDLEEIVLHKILEAITLKQDVRNLLDQTSNQDRLLNNLQTKYFDMEKHLREMTLMHSSVVVDLKERNKNFRVPAKQTRSVSQQYPEILLKSNGLTQIEEENNATELASVAAEPELPPPMKRQRTNQKITPMRPPLSESIELQLAHQQQLQSKQLLQQQKQQLIQNQTQNSKSTTPPISDAKKKSVSSHTAIVRRDSVSNGATSFDNKNYTSFLSPNGSLTLTLSKQPASGTAKTVIDLTDDEEVSPPDLTSSSRTASDQLSHSYPTQRDDTEEPNIKRANISITRVSGLPRTSLDIPTARRNHPAPLPHAPNQRSLASWKRIPPRPIIKIRKVATGFTVSWTLDDLSADHAKIVNYQIYAYQESATPPDTVTWRHVGDVKALVLPMAVTLTECQVGKRYHFAVRAVDEHSRIGLFSIPRTL